MNIIGIMFQETCVRKTHYFIIYCKNIKFPVYSVCFLYKSGVRLLCSLLFYLLNAMHMQEKPCCHVGHGNTLKKHSEINCFSPFKPRSSMNNKNL